MQLSPEAIEEFKKIYLEEFGEAISNDEALERALGLVHFFEIIGRPLPEDHSCSSCPKSDPEIDRTLKGDKMAS